MSALYEMLYGYKLCEKCDSFQKNLPPISSFYKRQVLTALVLVKVPVFTGIFFIMLSISENNRRETDKKTGGINQ